MKAAKRTGALALSCLLVCSSCATMLKGTTDNMAVMSDPVGAKVYVNDELKGTSPVSFSVPSKQDLNVRISKEGYQSQDVYSNANFRWGYEVWSFLCWVIPFVVDLADGAAWGHDPLTITGHLEPLVQPIALPAPTPAAQPKAATAPGM